MILKDMHMYLICKFCYNILCLKISIFPYTMSLFYKSFWLICKLILWRIFINIQNMKNYMAIYVDQFHVIPYGP